MTDTKEKDNDMKVALKAVGFNALATATCLLSVPFTLSWLDDDEDD